MKHKVGRLGSVLCAVCLAVSGTACVMPASAAEGFDPELAVFGVHPEGKCGDNVTWSLDSATGTLTISGTGDMKMTDMELMTGLMPLSDYVESIVISEGVTGICTSAFVSFENLTSVLLPDSLKTIGNCAFMGCKKLAEITVPDGLEHVGEAAFALTPWLEQQKKTQQFVIAGRVLLCCGDSLTGEPVSEETVRAAAGEDFFYHEELYALTIPDGVTEIADYALCGCYDMFSLTVPKGVKRIGNSAFAGCTYLVQVSLPDTLTEIGAAAFAGSPYISEFEIPASVTRMCKDSFRSTEWLEQKIAEEPFVIINGCLLSAGTARSGEVVIPDGVQMICPLAFNQCTEMTSVVIPDSVTEIGDGAFGGCTALTSVTFPSNLETIAPNAFCCCTALTEVSLPEGVKTVGRDAFLECTALTSLLLPDTLEDIDAGAFAGCSELTSVIFPDAMKSIGEGAFSCDDLRDIVLPEGLESLGLYAFSANEQLENVSFPETLTEIGGSAFEGTLWETLQTGQELFVIVNDCLMRGGTEASGDIVLPEGVREIAANAFANCKELLGVQIPESVTKIGDEAFSGTGLKELVIPENVNEIGLSAFAFCEDLEQVTLPASLTEIGTEMFYGCKNLETIIVPETVTEIADNAFAACSSLTLRGTSGSYAESYAKEHRIPFRAIPAVSVAGDVDCSGNVDVSDAVLLARYLVADSGAAVSAQGVVNADCDRSGQPDSNDLTMLLQFIAKQITF